jgi:hypothetical protein
MIITLFGDSAIRCFLRTRDFASPGCPGFALVGELQINTKKRFSFTADRSRIEKKA